MKIGIDKMGFYTPHTFVDMADLAHARGIDPGKYLVGLGQEQMALPPIYEDAVTLAANAALALLTEEDKKSIDLILVGSETGVDQSKSIAVYLQNLVGLPERVRAVEIKQACYGATMALQLAKGHILARPKSKVLVVATDIAKYGLATPGEATQGAGAVAILVSANPRLAHIEDQTSFLTEDIMDFWRPVYSDYAFADGKFSTEKYIHFFSKVWEDYRQETGRDFSDFAAICFHQPFTKLGQKALQAVLETSGQGHLESERLLDMYAYSKTYNKRVGNIYTGSLYLSLLSLLENAPDLKAGQRIGLFSYGSGAVGEFFSIQLSEGFEHVLRKEVHENLLNQRQKVSIADYERIFSDSLPKDGSSRQFERQPGDSAPVILSSITQHQRIYQA